SRGTRGSGRNRYPIEIEADYRGFRLYAGNRETGCIGKARRACTKNHRLRRCRLDTGLEPVAQRRHACSVRQFYRSGGGAKAGESGQVFSSCPLSALLPAALDERFGYMDVAAANKCARALRPAKLVRRNAYEVGLKLGNAARDSSCALHGIDVQNAR